MKTIIVSNTNLFKIAAQEMGDAMQWVAIARYNNIRDPMITALTQLTIPTPSEIFAGGIGPQ
jgi:hypothetical protein